MERQESRIDYETLFTHQPLPKTFDFKGETFDKFPEGFRFRNSLVVWEGEIEPKESGVYHFKLFYGAYTKVFLDNKLVVEERWRPSWNPNSVKFTADLQAGKKVPVRIEWREGAGSYIGLKVLSPRPEEEVGRLSMWSEMGNDIDYYFIHGDSMDEVISGYRYVTGKSPIMPAWAMGFWQSRERYKTQDEILTALRELRKRKMGVDNIVMDWQYWKTDSWGSHEFDPARFSDPKQMNDNLYRLGVDAWWMDASEPNIKDCTPMSYQKALTGPTALGPSAQYYNTYALVNAQAIYEGQLKENPDDRVFLLTRSGFAGLQRYSTASWSGDIGTRWEELKAQISAGLNFSISGIPYWTMDIGGFCVENRYRTGQLIYDKTGVENDDLKEWRELNARWYQFGTFTPLYRAHGQFPLREIYNIAPEDHPAYQTILYYNQLRYRLMPYIYSLAGKTYFDDYTIMRPLVMDYASDLAVRDNSTQYMFGPSMMIAPVYTYKATSREVYFPKGTDWYDLYTGKRYKGGQKQEVEAPFERMPIFAPSGGILLYGPEITYVNEKKPEVIDVYVYAGKDGSFYLYEDEGTNNNYQKGTYSKIDFNYSDATNTLTIGSREGSYPGMLSERTFNIIYVSPNAPAGWDNKGKPAKVIEYKGEQISVKL